MQIRLFGAPEVLIDGGPAPVDTRKAIAVLAVLAVEGRPVRRDTLAGMLWPEVTQERARGNLRRTLSALRSAIGAESVVADREVVGLDVAPDVVDVMRFEACAHDSPADCVDLYRGAFLEGFSVPDAPAFEEWQRAEADQFRFRVDALLDSMVEERARSGDPAAAAELARQRLSLDPLNEAAGRQAMTAHAGGGDRAAAVALYRELVRRLHDELGVEPLAETTAVYESVRRGEVVSPAPDPEPVEPTDRRTADPISELLLVGRDAEIAALDEAVTQPGLVIVAGEPGIGRTRLVEHWAGSRDAALLVRCHLGEQHLPYAPFSDWFPNEAPASVVRLFEELAAALPIGADGVLVVDDADLADEGTRAFLTYLLHRRERFGCSVVATWRSDRIQPGDAVWDLLVEGRRDGWAHEVVLDRLAPDTVAELVSGLADLTEDRIAEIVERADGLPFLAVEFTRAESGSGSQAMPPAVDDLMRGRLAAVTPLARQVVEALAVVDRPVEDRVLQKIAGRSDTEIGSAVDELTSVGIVDGDGEIALTHHLIGVVALADLPAARTRALHERAAEALPEAEAARHMADAGHPEQAADLHVRAAVAAEAAHANATALEHLRAALALGRGADAGVHRQIGDLETLEGRYEAARRSYEISAARSTGSELALVELALARLALRIGDGELAESHLDSARAELPATDADGPLAIDLATTRALVELELVRGDRATAAVDHAVALAHETGDAATRATAASAAALVAFRLSRPDVATEHARAAVRLAEIADEPLVMAAAVNVLGLVQSDEGDHPGAVSSFEQARRILARHGDVHRLGAVHANLADALHAAGRDDEARPHQLESARLFSEVSGPLLEGRPELWFLTAW